MNERKREQGESHPDGWDFLVVEDNSSRKRYSLEEVRNRVVLGDCFEVLRKMNDAVFDMVFIDPPYFLQLPKKELRRWKVKTVVEGVDDEWDRFSSFEEYDDFITRLLSGVKRVMKPNATVWVIATYHSIFRIGKIMQDLGFWILNDVIWVKTNPMPNWLGVRFTKRYGEPHMGGEGQEGEEVYIQQRIRTGIRDRKSRRECLDVASLCRQREAEG